MTTQTETITTEPAAAAAPAAPTLPPRALSVARGAIGGAWLGAILANGFSGLAARWGLGPVFDFALMALLAFLFVFLFDGIFTLVWKLLNAVLPRIGLGRLNAYVQAVSGALVGRAVGLLLLIFGNVLWPDSLFKYATLPLPGKLIAVAAGIAGALVALAHWQVRPGRRYALVGAAALALVGVGAYLFWPGSDGYLARAAAGPAVAPLALEDPGLPGPYAVGALSYGSGDNARRLAFGEDAALTTTSVDGSPIFEGYGGFAGGYFQWYNGFDFTRLPLNGLVWYPEGDGPFPLVLMVHGNHAMTEPSDPGYAYLGEHLASRGYIAVSVDENFLNGFGIADGDMKEMPLRAWVLLKHLEQWRAWNEAPGNPFYGRVDLDRVALIGHSRGGEAVAHAAEMNAKPVPPVSAVSSAEDFGFGIRGVVAIAPPDNRYKPGGGALRLSHADYLLLAGAHDGDMYYLDGLGQYSRANFDDNPDGFKAIAYLYRANHGNFNTVWGDADQGGFESLLLNRAPLLSAEAQRQAAKVLITGFLEASLNGRDDYRALFYNPAAADAWLPDDILVTAYKDAGFVPLDTNGRGDLDELDVLGGSASALGATTFKLVEPMLRNDETRVPNRAVLLGWEAGAEPAYVLTLPADAPLLRDLPADAALSFTLTNAGAEAQTGAAVEMTSSNGAAARLALADFGPLHPVLPVELTKGAWVAAAPGYDMPLARTAEYVPQTYDLPLAAFQAANPDFDPQRIESIRFLLDGRAAREVHLDEIGFRVPQTNN